MDLIVRVKMSEESFVSLMTRLVALDLNATIDPSAEITGSWLERSGGPPFKATVSAERRRSLAASDGVSVDETLGRTMPVQRANEMLETWSRNSRP